MGCRNSLLLLAFCACAIGPPAFAARPQKSDCSIELGGVLVDPDGLANANLICPYLDEGSEIQTRCSTLLPAAPERTPGAGEMADVTRLPDGQLEAMFFDLPTYRLCKDIFANGEFREAMSRIAPVSEAAIRERWSYAPRELDGIQRAMAAVFLSIRSWNYCHRLNSRRLTPVHAQFFRSDGVIVMYGTACDPLRLYDEDLGYYDIGHKFYLVAGHELGHAIYAAAGDQSPEEDRATLYGTYLAQCFSRTFEDLVRSYKEEGETPLMRQKRKCVLAKWHRLEQALSGLRRSHGQASTATGKEIKNAIECSDAVKHDELELIYF